MAAAYSAWFVSHAAIRNGASVSFPGNFTKTAPV